ncbi:MAG: helix-turn-helix domain-containing protein [Desulfobacterales bacterium]|nr:helix-turn-helix domain-containing protein [Desulfobacterales bacterium]
MQHITQANLDYIALQLGERLVTTIRTDVPYNDWLTVEEVMAIAHVSKRDTIYRWINAGHFYATKKTGQWLIDATGFNNWLGQP